MLYYIFPTVIIIASLFIIILIVVKKLPKLAAINIESIIEEKEREVKDRIILERLTRKFLGLKRLTQTLIKPLWDKIKDFFKDFYQKIIELEKTITQNARPLKSMEVKQEAKESLLLAKQLFLEGKLDSAEENYLKTISLEPRNIDAYEGLAQIYLAKKDYKKARQTYQHCIKLLTKKRGNGANGKIGRLACFYGELGSVYQLENKNQLALNNFKKAVELEPNNPRFLDLLLKISIILRNKELALQVFKLLKEADPANQKLPELEEEIDNLPVSQGQP